MALIRQARAVEDQTQAQAVQAVIFDMDGVLLDSEWAFRNRLLHKLHQMGLQPPDDFLSEMIGASSQQTLLLLQRIAPSEFDLQAFEEALAQEFEEDPLDRPDLIFPDAPPFVRTLSQAGCPLVLATSAKRYRAESILEMAELQGIFQAKLTHEDVQEHKPNPEVYKRALAALDLPPASCLVIEDSPRGIAAARAAGIRVAARRHPHYEIDQSEADWLFDTFEDLRSLPALAFWLSGGSTSKS